MQLDSKPYLEGFDPYIIPMQGELMDLLETWDYEKSTPEILLSGSYGSSKSIIMAHIVIMHCLKNPGACVFLGRRALPDLKKTIYNEIVEHLDTPGLIEGTHYNCRDTTAEIEFYNGSKVISGSWADKRYKKFRSLKISGFILEEGTENDLNDKEAFMTIKARLRRIPHIKQNFLIVATNPSSPEHWLYEYFIEGSSKHKTRRVFYSVTTDNPFLDPVYIKQLKADLSPKEVRRYIFGEWLSLVDEVVYCEYDDDLNYKDEDYTINQSLPVGITFDFNIGHMKPMSCALFQYDQAEDHFHFFEESVIFSARTENVLDDLYGRDLLEAKHQYIVTGDSAGKHRDTRSKRSDYQIIYDYLNRLQINFVDMVMPSNPPIRTRHNVCNAYLKNGLGESRVTIYRPCKMLRKGLKLTKLKEGSQYIEEDGPSAPWQHISTAFGYAIISVLKSTQRKSRMRQL